jgi:putative ABC transport system permease protein
MLLNEMLVVALQSVRANLFRAILTMLGIIIGVASVIAMVAIGSGARAAVDQQIEALGASVLSVRPGTFMHMGVARGSDKLSIDDAEALARDAGEALDAVVPEMAQQLQVKLGSRNESLRILGTTPEFAAVGDYKLQHGRLFSRADDAAKRPVAVVGSAVPAKLGMEAPALVGQTVYIRGIAFNVAGVLEEKGATGFRNVDEQIWIPLATARYRIFGTATLDSISARVRPGVAVERATVEIERIMRREHQLAPGRDNDFSISDPRQFFNVREAAANIFAILLASIASISLIVGGIGIMNIMLVSVTERTREIGIRKALGATRFNILLQFVIEAMVLCMLGGMVGIALGSGIALLLAKLLGWQTAVSPAAILMAFGFSAGVGLFFGIWPARKASRLDPIEALRYE